MYPEQARLEKELDCEELKEDDVARVKEETDLREKEISNLDSQYGEGKEEEHDEERNGHKSKDIEAMSKASDTTS